MHSLFSLLLEYIDKSLILLLISSMYTSTPRYTGVLLYYTMSNVKKMCTIYRWRLQTIYTNISSNRFPGWKTCMARKYAVAQLEVGGDVGGGEMWIISQGFHRDYHCAYWILWQWEDPDCQDFQALKASLGTRENVGQRWVLTPSRPSHTTAPAHCGRHAHRKSRAWSCGRLKMGVHSKYSAYYEGMDMPRG